MNGLTRPDPSPVRTRWDSLDSEAPSAPDLPSETPVTVVLAHQGVLVRGGLRMLLDSFEDLTVVAEAEDLDAVVRYVRGHRPDVLVVDLAIGWPERHAIEAVVQVRAQVPEVAVVVVSREESVTDVRDAIAAGALGCVPATATTHQFVDTIRRAASGEVAVPIEILTAIAKLHTGGPDGLSGREVEVIGLVALGYTNAEIAELLFLSVRTVESHRARMRLKIGSRTRAELVAYALDHRLTEDPAVIDAVKSNPHLGPRGHSHKRHATRRSPRPEAVGRAGARLTYGEAMPRSALSAGGVS